MRRAAIYQAIAQLLPGAGLRAIAVPAALLAPRLAIDCSDEILYSSMMRTGLWAKLRLPAVETYTAADERRASDSEPLPAEHRRHQLTRMWQALASIERAPAPSTEDWRLCADAVNMLETLVTPAPEGCGALQDPGGLLADAVAALAQAGQRHQAIGAPIRLNAAGIHAVRAILEDYAGAIDQLPARTMIQAHRLTEARIRALLQRDPAPGFHALAL